MFVNSTSAPHFTTGAGVDVQVWNGPVCVICGRGYDGSRGPHACAEADLQALIDYLQRKLDEVRSKA